MNWKVWRERLEGLFERYGPTAVGTYFVLYAITWTTIYALIQAGFEFTSAAGTVGAVGTTCVVNKTVQPARIAAAIALTPLVAWVMERVRGPVPAAESNSPDNPTSTTPPSPD